MSSPARPAPGTGPPDVLQLRELPSSSPGVTTGAGGGRVSIAGVACCRAGDRPHLFYVLCAYRRRKGEAKGVTWTDYRDLMIAAHHHL